MKWRLSLCGGLMRWNFAMSHKGTFLVNNHCIGITCLELLGAVHGSVLPWLGLFQTGIVIVTIGLLRLLNENLIFFHGPF